MKEGGMNRLTRRSWQNLLAALVLLVSISAAGGLAAQTEKGAGAQGDTKNDCVGEAKKLSAHKIVRDKIDKWRTTTSAGKSFQERASTNEITLVEGIHEADVRTDEKRWGKARSLAYHEAFIDAMRTYVSLKKTRETTKVLTKSFDADLDPSDIVYQQGESDDRHISRVVDKVVALGERRLDKELQMEGLSTDEIDRMTPPQKKIAYSKEVNRKSTGEAFGSAAGLLTIKTFEAVDCEGLSVIGVVAATSHRQRALAGQIAQKRAIRPDGGRKGKPIAKKIWVLSKEQLTQEFGARVFWDENGYPTIVAFGQWGWSSKGLSNRKKARRSRFATKQAKSNAIGHLTFFINSSTLFKNESDKGSKVEESFRVYKDNRVEEQDTTKIFDKLVKSAKLGSDVTLVGLKEQRTWYSGHPIVDDAELVGVIVSWSPAQEEQIRAAEGEQPKHLPPAEKKVQKPRASSGSSKSLDLMKAKDF